MGERFNNFLNNMPTLVRDFDALKILINNPNPEQKVIDKWQKLMSCRDEALNELAMEYQSIPDNSYPSSYPWIGQFIERAYSAANNYPGGKEYLRPVAESFRDLTRFKILNSQQWVQNEWKMLLTNIENLIQYL